jgi:hypothetical protein
MTVDGRLRAAVGKAQLLLKKKFPQFDGLCELNINAETRSQASDSDLEGFWDFVLFAVGLCCSAVNELRTALLSRTFTRCSRSSRA